MAVAALAAILFATAPRGSALLAARGRNESRSHFASVYRQALRNNADTQYVAQLSVGGQTMQGIFDTGSFELVVFSKNCLQCGKAKAYDENQSERLQRGNRTRKQSYGSGSCTSFDAKDEVVIGDAMVPAQDMWVAKECEMSALMEASFTAIVGLGPPGWAAKKAEQRKKEHERLVANYEDNGLPLPQTIQDAIKHDDEDLADADTKVELLRSLTTRTISACYGRGSGTPGWIVWNDITREGQPGVKKVPVTGQVSWGVKIGSASLMDSAGKEMAISCREGCGAIVDTGTSLIGVPSIFYNRVLDILAPNDGATVDCTNLNSLPRLLLTLGSEKFYLPPSAYIGQMSGQLNVNTAGLMRNTRRTARQHCSLLLLDLGRKRSQFGPTFVLGISFLRYYYTTFDLGTGPEDRSLFISPASDGCEPNGEAHVQQIRQDPKPMMIDASKIRVPQWLSSGDNHVL